MLDRYLKEWGGIIVNGNRPGSELRLAFVDSCCGTGLYASFDEEREHEPGSALIGPDNLDDLVAYATANKRRARAKALLINIDGAELETAVTAAVQRSDSTRIEAECGEFANLGSRVIKFCGNWFCLVFIDPYGPQPAPFSIVSEIVGGRFNDTLINFPFLTFQRVSGLIRKSPRTPSEEARLNAADRFMGGEAWRQIATSIEARGTKNLERELTKHYHARLGSLGVYTLSMPLHFPHIRNRPLYHLFFTSHNVAGLAAAKRVFQEAEEVEIAIHDEANPVAKAQMALFPDAREPEVDIRALAELLAAEFRGQSPTVEILIARGILEPRVLEEHVRKAISRLRREKRVAPSGRHYADAVVFKAP